MASRCLAFQAITTPNGMLPEAMPSSWRFGILNESLGQ